MRTFRTHYLNCFAIIKKQDFQEPFKDELRSLSSGSSSGYGSATSNLDLDTAATSLAITSQANCCPSQAFFASANGLQGGIQRIPEDDPLNNTESGLLPSISDFQFTTAVNAANNGLNGMWNSMGMGADFWSPPIATAVGAPINYESSFQM